MRIVGLKIDVDTHVGTHIGVPNLARFLNESGIRASFFFSLGPDNTGRSIFRLFQPGFFQKVRRTKVISVYGLKTLLNGILWPGPHIAKSNKEKLKEVQDLGHEIGIHCYDHTLWQNRLFKMNENQVRFELHKAQEEFKHVFGITAKAFASPGWLASFFSLKSYDDHNLLYASDCRGKTVFYPTLDYKGYKKTFQTLQIPTTFPTLDELLNSKFFDLKNNLEYDLEKIIDNYVNSFKENQLNILTIHAEFEGMAFYDLFKALVQKAQAQGVQFVPLEEIAKDILRKKSVIPILEVKQAYIDGRSSSVTVHEPYNIEKFKQPFIN